MFFQFILELILIIVFLWIVWKQFIIPLLKNIGIDVDKPITDVIETIKTDETKDFEKLQKEFKKKKASRDAAIESVHIKKEIHEMDEKITEAKKEIKEIK